MKLSSTPTTIESSTERPPTRSRLAAILSLPLLLGQPACGEGAKQAVDSTQETADATENGEENEGSGNKDCTTVKYKGRDRLLCPPNTPAYVKYERVDMPIPEENLVPVGNSGLTRDLIDISDRIKREHIDGESEPLGTQYTFSYQGVKYVAAIMKHFKLSKLRHPGITLFRVKETEQAEASTGKEAGSTG
ncbi:MAG: hypothetical protein OEY44_02620 [Candidatus Peregrinibacteria bacterium]|nr:hypothetical protein [Candidatus Peregrinibacteria bacterium]